MSDKKREQRQRESGESREGEYKGQVPTFEDPPSPPEKDKSK